MKWLPASLLLFAAVGPIAMSASKAGAVMDKAIREAGKKTAELLPERPQGFGRPLTDRAAWERLAKHPSYRSVVPQAERLLKEPLPESPDELYLDFSRTGNRTRWQKVAGERRGRVSTLALAECVESKGRFLPALEQVVAALGSERTWVMPAHDGGLANFQGKSVDIDLGSSHVGVDLATAHWLLGDKLSEPTRQLLRDNVRRRILDPYLAMAGGKRPKNWWMTCTNNWNAVCLANVTGAALALVEPREERARFVEAALEHSRYFLQGFTRDGYCSEGVGYWNYGFGHYVLLAEAVCQATGGGVDLMARDEVRAPATYGARIEIQGGVYPAFSDCGVGSRPSAAILHFVSRRYRLGASPAEDDRLFVSPGGGLFAAMMYSFPNSATQAPPPDQAASTRGLRDWFEQAGILLGRPAPGSACRLAVALKGGHNAEHHNHNDVGSYVVVLGSRPVLLDPGSEVYTARTFSSRRYESQVLNSFGHPVPRVAGQLQRPGRDAQARVVRTEFTDQADTLVLDLRSAYAGTELKALQRTFVYSREGAGSLTVSDEVAFASPKEFESALITLGKWEKLGPNALRIQDGDAAVRVDIQAAGGEVEIVPDELREDVSTKSLPIRLCLRLKAPVTQATITARITPL
jgi:hypothetical protein